MSEQANGDHLETCLILSYLRNGEMWLQDVTLFVFHFLPVKDIQIFIPVFIK